MVDGPPVPERGHSGEPELLVTAPSAAAVTGLLQNQEGGGIRGVWRGK